MLAVYCTQVFKSRETTPCRLASFLSSSARSAFGFAISSKHRAQALATLELSHESDQFLSDIGLSRGGVKARHPGDLDAWFW